MKTIQDLKQNRLLLEDEIRLLNQKKTWTKPDRSTVKKHYKEMRLIDLCVRYLETSPDESFLRTTLAKIEKGIAIHRERAPIWAKDKSNLVKFKDSAAAQKGYLNLVEVPTMLEKVKTLKYILN